MEFKGPFSARSIFLLGFILLGIYLSFTRGFSRERWALHSPDQGISLQIQFDGGKLFYSAGHRKRQAIAISPLGIVRDDEDFSDDLKFLSKTENTIDEAYELVVGKQLKCRNHANQLVLNFENYNKEHISVVFRAYNDGIAYRYEFHDTDDDEFTVLEEKSGFAFAKNTKAWIQPYDMNVRKKPCYETWYKDGVLLDTLSDSPAGYAFPVLLNSGGLWMLVTEAGLDESYPATHLSNRSNNLFTIRFPEKEEVTSDADPEPVSTLPWSTPWRAVVIGSSLSVIQETTLVTNLNPPVIAGDFSWVKPGRSSWSWWFAGQTPKDFDIQKAYVDFTAEMGWEYVLIDSGWPQMKGGTIEDLIAYANRKHVGIVLWYHSGVGREKDTLSYANVMAFPEERKKEFAKIRQWGAKGVKVDFFDSDKQPVIKRYFEILRDAAEAQIMVNFHGSTLPRGWERTYPHLVSMESVKGAEGAGRQEFCDRAPSHNTILPFTRNAVGSMDYTPVTFTNKRQAIRRTTFGHELALSIVFESGVFHFADNMKSYQSLPDEVKGFLRQVPVAWDETRYLAGMPGDFDVVARRKGSDWYIAGINGQGIEQQLSFDLPFLQPDANMNLITDGVGPGTFLTTSMQVNSEKNNITLIPNGGFVLFIARQ
jgi:alpha-glucosidase